MITIDDPSSGGPPIKAKPTQVPPQAPAQPSASPVADDPLKAATLCGPPPLPNRPKRPVEQMMASSSAGISGGCSQTSQSKKFLSPTSKGGGLQWEGYSARGGGSKGCRESGSSSESKCSKSSSSAKT